MKKRISILCISLFAIVVFPFTVFSQTTGKISGKVFDQKTGMPLPGTNIVIEGTYLGAAADENGDFYIINLSPGTYTLKIYMIGYKSVIAKDIRVSVNRTVFLEIKMQATVLKGEEVVVTARIVSVKKDQTSSIRNISSEEIEKLPVESVDQVVAMQPGVVVGHFRGGRYEEVSYLIDGMQVDESFGQSGRTVSVNPEVVSDVEIITGTFNAEYGRAMSGIVNIVTKEGGNVFKGSCSYNLGNYLTSHKNIFINLNDLDMDRRKDFKFSLSGPIFKDRVSFVINGRYQDNKGHLSGIHRFNVDDYTSFTGEDSTSWDSEHNGTDKYVVMNWGKHYSFFSKLTFKPTSSLKTSLIYNLNDDKGQGYNHYSKYNPYGRATSYGTSNMIAFQLNHMLSQKAFYEFKASYVDDYSGNYLYKDPYDSRYVHDMYSVGGSSCGFNTGGQQKHHLERTMKDVNLKFDFNWQVSKNHSIKTGCLYIHHDLDNYSASIRNEFYGTDLEMDTVYDSVANKIHYPYYESTILPDTSIHSDIYSQKPYEFTYYIQDKMEFDEMVINIGIRYDYFNPNTTYPSQLRNPANQLYFPFKDENGDIVLDEDGNVVLDPERMSTYPKAEVKYQISPRFGLCYKLGKSALLRFSYGHFFQMPPLYSIYQNHSVLIAPTDFSTTNGNPQINAQKTVQYEIGLWQELMPGMDLEVAVFYRDIYDLLSAKVITTYNQIRYGLYSNKDYGNVRGLELKYNLRYGPFVAFINYTFQYTKGNADSPTFTFNRAGSNTDPVNRLIPMSWDQRHTLNLSAGYHRRNYGATLTFYYNSGTPYTWSPIAENPLSRVNLFPNNDYRPSQMNVDLNAYYNLFNFKGTQGRLTLLVYNLLDRLNEVGVYGSTGRAYTTIARESVVKSHRSDFNDYWDRIKNPGMYSTPRLVKIGFEVTF